MITGQPPFPGDKLEKVYTGHLEKELTPPDHINMKLSAGIGEVVEFMMAKDREQRYRSPSDLIIDLECLLLNEPPKLARQRIKAATLAELSEGEAEHDPPAAGREQVLPWILGALLAVSALLNLFLLMKR
jgi:serine/threonine-protein kinase